jgi:hypothetical protein
MAAFSLEVVGEGTARTFTQNEIRIGTSPECNFVLSAGEYPAVGLEHLRIRFDRAEWWAEDLGGANGTLLNGRRFTRHLLSPGDVLRLTNDGPELKVQFTTAVQVAPTILVSGPAEVTPTRTSVLPPTQPGESMSLTPAAQASTKQSRSVATSKSLAAQPKRISDPTGSSRRSQTNVAISPDEEAMIEQKLNLLRNILIAAAIVTLFSVAFLLSQMQEISAIRRNLTETRKELADMRMELHAFGGKVYPELESRLKQNSDEADQKLRHAGEKMSQDMDQKMQRLEDRFVSRMGKEIPGIMDEYLKSKKEEVVRGKMQK